MRIFLYNFAHFGELCFHIADKLELVSRSVEIVLRTGGTEVGIAREVVGEEAGSALEGHHHSTDGEHLKLACGESALRTLDEALYVKLIEVDVEVHLVRSASSSRAVVAPNLMESPKSLTA